jgi:hypothetical protein
MLLASFLPNIESPYPDDFRPGDEISEFRYEIPLVLIREAEAVRCCEDCESSYIVGEDYTVSYVLNGRRRRLTVPRGMCTDLASVPRALQFIVNRIGRHLEAAIVHDFLFIAWQLLEDQKYPAKKDDFAFANAVMFAALKAAKVPWIQRKAIEIGLQFPWVAWSVYEGRNKKMFVDLGTAEEGYKIAA